MGDESFHQDRLRRHADEVALILSRIMRDRARADVTIQQLQSIMDVIRIRTEYLTQLDMLRRDSVITRALTGQADKAETEALMDKLDYEKQKYEFDQVIKRQ